MIGEDLLRPTFFDTRRLNAFPDFYTDICCHLTILAIYLASIVIDRSLAGKTLKINRLLAISTVAFSAMSTIGQGAHPNNEIVHVTSVREENHAKRVVMRSKEATYVFYCNIGAPGCTTPISGKSYWLLTDSQPVGKLDMAWMKDWYVEYHDATNMGIIPTSNDWMGKQKDFMGEYRQVGVYWLSSMTVTR